MAVAGCLLLVRIFGRPFSDLLVPHPSLMNEGAARESKLFSYTYYSLHFSEKLVIEKDGIRAQKRF